MSDMNNSSFITTKPLLRNANKKTSKKATVSRKAGAATPAMQDKFLAPLPTRKRKEIPETTDPRDEKEELQELMNDMLRATDALSKKSLEASCKMEMVEGGLQDWRDNINEGSFVPGAEEEARAIEVQLGYLNNGMVRLTRRLAELNDRVRSMK